MSIIYSLIYNSKINWILRNLNYLLSPLLPEKIKIHPSGILKVKVGHSKIIKLSTNQTSFVTRELFWKGSEDYEYTSIFIKLVQKVDCFFDVGSSIGYYSILDARVNKGLIIYAFEPSISAMLYFVENIKLNAFENRIKPNSLALSPISGTIEFNEITNQKYPSVLNLSGEHNIGTKPHLNSKVTRATSETLDNYMKNHNVEVDVIKLDTEGCEDQILKGAKSTIEKFKPIIICETLFNTIETQLEDIMLKYGYEFYNHFNDI